MKKLIIPFLLFILLLATAVYFFNGSRSLVTMSEIQIAEQPLVIQYEDIIYEELINELPDDFLEADNDRDGIANCDELALGLSPFTEDTDNDGLSDYEEINIYNSDPLKWSTADDGISDLAKVMKQLDVNSPLQNYTPETIAISNKMQLIPENLNAETLYILSSYKGEAFKNLTPSIISPFRLYDFNGSVQIDISTLHPKDAENLSVYFYNTMSSKTEQWNAFNIDGKYLTININETIKGKPIIITKDSLSSSKLKEWFIGLFSNKKNKLASETISEIDYQSGYTADSGFQIDKHAFSFQNMPVECSPGGICSGFAFVTNQIYNDMKPNRKMNKNSLYIPIIGEIFAAPEFDMTSSEYDIVFERKTPFKYTLSDNALKPYDYKAIPQESYETVTVSDISQPDQEVINGLSNYWLYSNKATLSTHAGLRLCNYKISYDFSKIREVASLFNKNQIICASLVGGIGSHSVNAYKLEQDENDTDLFRLYIYDNNYPNNMMAYRDSSGKLKKQKADIFMVVNRYPKKMLTGIHEMFNFSYGNGSYAWTNTNTTNPAGVMFYRSLEPMRLIEIDGFNYDFWERYKSIVLDIPEQMNYNEEVQVKVMAIDSLGIPRDVSENADCNILIPNDLYSAGCLKNGNILFLDKGKIGTPYKEFTVTAHFRGLKISKNIMIGEEKSQQEKETETDDKFIYSSRNILLGGRYVFDGQWIYYNNPFTNELYKIRPDLTDNTFICSDTPTYINAYFDEIIYGFGEYTICATNSDGSNHRIVLDPCGEDSPLISYNNKLLVDYEGICYFDIDKGEDSSEFLEYKNEPFLYDGWVFHKDLENNSYNKMQADLSDDQVIIPDFNLINCVVDGEWVYGFDDEAGALMRINLSNGSRQNISDEDWFYRGVRMYYTVSNGYVYYVNEEDEDRLYRIDCNTKDIEPVTIQGNIKDFGVAAGWIFYETNDSSHIISEDMQTHINGEDVLKPTG